MAKTSKCGSTVCGPSFRHGRKKVNLSQRSQGPVLHWLSGLLAAGRTQQDSSLRRLPDCGHGRARICRRRAVGVRYVRCPGGLGAIARSSTIWAWTDVSRAEIVEPNFRVLSTFISRIRGPWVTRPRTQFNNRISVPGFEDDRSAEWCCEVKICENGIIFLA